MVKLEQQKRLKSGNQVDLKPTSNRTRLIQIFISNALDSLCDYVPSLHGFQPIQLWSVCNRKRGWRHYYILILCYSTVCIGSIFHLKCSGNKSNAETWCLTLLCVESEPRDEVKRSWRLLAAWSTLNRVNVARPSTKSPLSCPSSCAELQQMFQVDRGMEDLGRRKVREGQGGGKKRERKKERETERDINR